MVVSQGNMLPTSAFLSAFLDCLSTALDLPQQKALFLLGQGAEPFKTLLLLGGKDPNKVTKLFSLLTTALPSMLKTVPHEDSDQSSLEGLTATLSCAIASKLDDISRAACQYFSEMFKRIMLLAPETPTYSRMVLSKIILLDPSFIKHCKLATEIDGSRMEFITNLLDSNHPVCNLVGSHLEGVCCPKAKVVPFSSDDERISFQYFYNQLFSRCTPQAAENLIDPLVTKLTSGKLEGPVTPFSAICILKAELKSPGTLSIRSDQAKNFTVSMCISMIKDKTYPKLKLLQLVNLIIQILVADYSSGKQIPPMSIANFQSGKSKEPEGVSASGNSRSPLGLRIQQEESLLIMDVLLSITDTECRNMMFRNFCHPNTPPLVLDELISALKRYSLKAKPHFLDTVDAPIIEFMSASVPRFSIVSKDSRSTLLELVMESINHPLHFREANLVLLGLVAQVDIVDIARDTVLKILKQLSKDISQVKYNNLVAGNPRFDDAMQGTANVAPTSAIKLFKAGIQLDIIKTGLESIILDPESRRNFIQINQKLKEVLSASPLVLTVDSILGILMNRPMLDLSSHDDAASQAGFDGISPGKLNKYSRLPRIAADRISNGAQEGPSFSKDVNTKGYHPRGRNEQMQDSSLKNILKSMAPKGRLMSATGGYPVKDIPVPTPHPRSATNYMNTSTNIRSTYNETRAFSGYSLGPSQMSEEAKQNAKKRVLSSLNKSIKRSEEEKQAAGGGHYSPIAPLASQIPNWSDMSLVEKTRMLGEKRDYQKKIGYTAGAGNNSTFRPEINPTKQDRCIFDFDSVPPLAESVPPLVTVPYQVGNEDSEDMEKAIRILINTNKRLLKVIYSELYAHRGVRGTSVPAKVSSEQLKHQRTLSLGSLMYFIKTVVAQIQINPSINVLPEECKILMNRTKIDESADGLNLEEFKNFLIHLADLITRKSCGAQKNMLETLEMMIEISNQTYKKTASVQQGGDPQVIDHLMRNKPEVLPLVTNIVN
jgi:hypothetical protein